MTSPIIKIHIQITISADYYFRRYVNTLCYFISDTSCACTANDNDDVLCLFIPRARTPFSMGEENITFADLLQVIRKNSKCWKTKLTPNLLVTATNYRS